MDANSKEIYIPLQPIRGEMTKDGNYILTAKDLKNLNDNLYAIAKKIQGGLTFGDMTSEAGQVVSDIEGNVSTLQQTATSLTASVSAANGNATTALQTANGLAVDVQSLENRNTVAINANGLYVTDKYGNSTRLSGDHIKSGTIEGVELISESGSQKVSVTDGRVWIYNGSSSIGYVTYYNNSLYIYGDNLKLNADGNISISAQGNSIWLGGSGDTLHIGDNYGGTSICIGSTPLDTYIENVVNSMP